MREDDVNYVEVYKWLDSYRTVKSDRVRQQLQNLIVMACLPLVRKIACGLARRSTDPIDDLIQVGSVGLLKAVNSFDSSRSKNFRIYATHMITGEIRHYLRDKCAMIKAPREIQELAFRIYQISKYLEEENGVKPTDVEIAEHLQLDLGKVYEVIDIERRKQMISLDQITGFTEEDQYPLHDKIADTKEITKQDLKEMRTLLEQAMSSLNPELLRIVEMHYFEDVSQIDIAKELGISHMQVYRRIKKALSALFKYIQAEGGTQ
ncbi:sigma-70 family RNA polymerase sigma factor [bacterium]|nr:sigma-70 family RNA polymerase sigma factor [bacterium]